MEDDEESGYKPEIRREVAEGCFHIPSKAWLKDDSETTEIQKPLEI